MSADINEGLQPYTEKDMERDNALLREFLGETEIAYPLEIGQIKHWLGPGGLEMSPQHPIFLELESIGDDKQTIDRESFITFAEAVIERMGLASERPDRSERPEHDDRSQSGRSRANAPQEREGERPARMGEGAGDPRGSSGTGGSDRRPRAGGGSGMAGLIYAAGKGVGVAAAKGGGAIKSIGAEVTRQFTSTPTLNKMARWTGRNVAKYGVQMPFEAAKSAYGARKDARDRMESDMDAFGLEGATSARLDRMETRREGIRRDAESLASGMNAKGNELSRQERRRLAERLSTSLRAQKQDGAALDMIAQNEGISEANRKRIREEATRNAKLGETVSQQVGQSNDRQLKSIAELARAMGDMFKRLATRLKSALGLDKPGQPGSAKPLEMTP
jgi:hypothetical protein